MRPILIDTNAFSALKRGDEAIVEIFRYAEVIAISPIVIGELLFGFDNGNRAKENRHEFQQFLDTPRVKVLPVLSETAYFFSQITLSLKRKGKPIPTNDIWIAAQAFEHGCVLCTYDAHFQAIEGLLLARSVADLAI